MHQYNYVAKTVDNLIKDIPNTAKRKNIVSNRLAT